MKILNCVTLSWITWLIFYLIASLIAADFDIRNWQDRGAFVLVSIVTNLFVVGAFLAFSDIQSTKE
jgi:hypothetical protein